MASIDIIWDLDDDPDGNVQHIAEHGVTPREVEEVIFNPESNTATSRSSENRITFGYTSAGRYLAIVWEHVLDDTLMIYPVTAYDAPEPGRAKTRRNK